MKSFVSKLGLFSYTIHNLIAHPLMELLHLAGFTELGNRLHDATLPKSHNQQEEQDQDVASREDQEDE